ncbi:MAG: type II toxin-antitoxin system VapC family toxin [Acidimicrobiia bacterium]|nr:type II toxin-antitoxin system VapC family toxin [Acidimicrobiia bacterium]
MIILDTNVLSALMRQAQDRDVVSWLDGQPRTSIWTTAVTVLEVRYGLQILPAGTRRAALLRAFDTVLREKIDERIVPFDLAAAHEAATLMAVRHRKGKPGDLRDTLLAGIVLAHRATLATRNTRHFEDLAVPVVNPWEPS